MNNRKLNKLWFFAFALTALSIFNACDKASDIPLILGQTGGENRPHIILSSPQSNASSLDVNSGIFVEFSEPMDHKSVENSFVITGSASVDGEFRWAGNRMYYDLNSPLTPGATHVMNVAGTALSAESLAMEVDYIVHFTVGSRTDGPTITASTPADNSQSVNANTSIRIVFSRPMQRFATEQAFGISPGVVGEFSWAKGDTELVFTPNELLTFATTYSVSVSTSAKDREGISPSSGHTFNFQVGTDFQGPEVETIFEAGEVNPTVEGAAGIWKESSFVVNFSERMDYSTVEDNFSLTRLSNGSTVNGVFNWNTGLNQLTFKANKSLEPGNDYRLEVHRGAKDEAGNALLNPVSVRFRVDNSRNATLSNYLGIESVKFLNTAVAPGEDVYPVANGFAEVSLAGSSAELGASIWLEVKFSNGVDIDINSVYENLSFRKIGGLGGSSPLKYPPDYKGGTDRNTIVMKVEKINDHVYELELRGGRSGILSQPVLLPSDQILEEPTWFEEDISIRFKVKEP